MNVSFQYGDSTLSTELPDSTVVVRKGETYHDPPTVDPRAATKEALAKPLGMSPLAELAKAGMKAVIAFPDRVKGGAHPLSHRRVSIPIIIEILLNAGLRKEDITLLCAAGLHRKNTRQELYQYLGSEIMDSFWGGRVKMHDAEDPEGIVDFGFSEYGDVVEVNRLIAEADLPILVGHAQGNPYGGYSGGYKMLVTGLTTWQSIRCHHAPSTMYRQDFLPAGIHSHMRKQFDAIGRAIEDGMGKKFFVVDAVLGSDSQVLGVYAGYAPDVQRESWKLAEKRTNVYLDMPEKADVLIFGLPRSFHYGPGMGTNPILMLQAIGGEITRAYGAFREGGVIIAPSICDGWFNDEWFPSYGEIYRCFQEVVDQTEATRFEEQIAHNQTYIEKYRHAYAYHPWHGMSMLYMGGIAWKHASAIFIPGARKPGYARAMGCTATPTIADAMRQAEGYVGRNPRILALPDLFASVPVHLHIRNR